MIFVAEAVFNHAGEGLGDTTELLVTKGIFVQGAGNQRAVFILGTLSGHYHTVAFGFYCGIHFGDKLIPGKGNFREDNNMRWIAGLFRG